MISPPQGIDDAKFFSDMAGESDMVVVLLGVVYMERELVALAEENVVHPSAIKAMDLDFTGRIALAIALGLDPSFGPPLRALGTLRNGFAHRLREAAGKSDVDALYKALSGSQKQAVAKSFERVRASAPEKYRTVANLSHGDRLRLLIVALRQAIRAARMIAAGE